MINPYKSGKILTEFVKVGPEASHDTLNLGSDELGTQLMPQWRTTNRASGVHTREFALNMAGNGWKRQLERQFDLRNTSPKPGAVGLSYSQPSCPIPPGGLPCRHQGIDQDLLGPNGLTVSHGVNPNMNGPGDDQSICWISTSTAPPPKTELLVHCTFKLQTGVGDV